MASGYDVTIKDETGRVTTHNFDTKSQGLALKEAVAQGAERIAWTTGEQQNERHGLS